MQIRCPEIDPQLIAYLEAVFPDRAVDPRKVDASIAFGQCEVVRHLKAVMETQQQEAFHVST